MGCAAESVGSAVKCVGVAAPVAVAVAATSIVSAVDPLVQQIFITG